MPTTDCGIIILAAGSSSRLGVPKQLLMYKNKTLLQHTIDEATAFKTGDNVIVVTGASEDRITSFLSTGKVHFVHNEKWQLGMASSMQAGLLALLSKHQSLASVIIMLCDQPYISSHVLREIMKEKRTTGKGIVACQYKETLGVPALFSHSYFSALLSLQGLEGAKKIITTYADDVAAVPFPLGAVDIDTMEDYEQLIK